MKSKSTLRAAPSPATTCFAAASISMIVASGERIRRKVAAAIARNWANDTRRNSAVASAATIAIRKRSP